MSRLITITCDAGFKHTTKKGGFATWIVCDHFRITKSGAFKTYLSGSLEAELGAIINSLHIVKHHPDHVNYKTILVNTDCLYAIHVLTGKTKKALKYESFVSAYKSLITDLNVSVIFKHVKGHTRGDTKRTWVNNWADSSARKHY